MNWILQFFKSSLGKKIIMSLTGLFLCLFLVVHLMGNFQLLKDDEGEAFNKYTYFMTHNPLIKFISYSLYTFILLHTIQGLILVYENRKSRISNYNTKHPSKTTFGSRHMGLLGTMILFFLVGHMGDFWFKMKQGVLETVNYVDYEAMQNLYSRVSMAYDQWWIVLLYVISMVVLAFHLEHGFQSAFQTLGFNHPRYTPIIKGIGRLFCILIPLGFAIIPIYHFLFK
ncbi:MAG: succinate dehydrogenase cytochrome b subunit [Saprospiraceae bacterium]|nr:succinate dehydrogenase cytochrome b subunit [Saprospiraceae bacterium]